MSRRIERVIWGINSKSFKRYEVYIKKNYDSKIN